MSAAKRPLLVSSLGTLIYINNTFIYIIVSVHYTEAISSRAVPDSSNMLDGHGGRSSCGTCHGTRHDRLGHWLRLQTYCCSLFCK